MYAMSATFSPPPPSAVASPFARRPDNRHSQLLTPISHFPSRMLPPPGTTPPSFASGSMVAGTHCIPIGTLVQVRRFNVRERVWMNWVPGRIIEHRVERFHVRSYLVVEIFNWLTHLKVGREMDLYDVDTSASGQPKIDTYIPFLGELRDGCIYNPSDSVKEMLTKVAEMVRLNLNEIQLRTRTFLNEWKNEWMNGWFG